MMPGGARCGQKGDSAGNALEIWGKKAIKRLHQPAYVSLKKHRVESPPRKIIPKYIVTLSHYYAFELFSVNLIPTAVATPEYQDAPAIAQCMYTISQCALNYLFYDEHDSFMVLCCEKCIRHFFQMI